MSGFTPEDVLSNGQNCQSHRNSETFEKFKIPFAAHCGGAQKVLDNEHGNFMVSGNDQRPNYAGFGVDEMISTRPIKDESISLKNRSHME
jgi:hypothetical protein